MINPPLTQPPSNHFHPASNHHSRWASPSAPWAAGKEGSWWWTSHSDELGSSRWAATAQQRLVEPLGHGCAWRAAADAQRNEFRMLSDEEPLGGAVEQWEDGRGLWMGGAGDGRFGRGRMMGRMVGRMMIVENDGGS